jgi:rhamnulokinase
MPTAVAAVDFGAASIRVCRIELDVPDPRLEVVHRYAHHPAADPGGTLRWDWDRLVAEMVGGLEKARARGPLASIGIDTWGVDYGLLDAGGELVEPPVSYRDTRTAGYLDIVERIGEQHLYDIAGLQLMPFNTIFQLAVHDRTSLARARHVLMLPELLAYHLTGEITAELTSAGTSGLLDLATLQWSGELADAVELRREVLPDVRPPGTLVGKWRDVPVHLVGGHDTASAVLGGAADGAAYVSAGTWLLVGRMLAGPDTSEAARRGRFTNEQGAAGGVRFLRNIAGWWLVEECRRRWDEPDLDALLAAAADAGPVPAADATDPRFLAPADMPSELAAAAGLGTGATRAEIIRCAVESMARSTAQAVAQLGMPGVQVFGGGARSALLIDLLAEHVGGPVTVGPIEATALGNAISQGLALGVFGTVDEGRRALSGPPHQAPAAAAADSRKVVG